MPFLRSCILVPALLLFIFLQIEVFAQNTSDVQENGWISLRTNFNGFYVVINNDIENARIYNSNDVIPVPTGEVHIRIVDRRYDDRQFEAYVAANDTVYRSFLFNTTPEDPQTTFSYLENRESNLSLSSDKNSVIYLDGNKIATETTALLINPGKHSLYIEHPEYGALAKDFDLKYGKTLNIAQYNSEQSNTPIPIKLLPGAGYVSNGQIKKGMLTYLILGGLTASAITSRKIFLSNKGNYNEYAELYKNTVIPADAIKYRTKANDHRRKMITTDVIYTTSIISGILVYTLTTIDGLRKPKEGYKGPIKTTLDAVSVRLTKISGITYTDVGFKINLD